MALPHVISVSEQCSFYFYFYQARGVSVEEFLRKQEEIIERFDSGFDGYRGLNGERNRVSSNLYRVARVVMDYLLLITL